MFTFSNMSTFDIIKFVVPDILIAVMSLSTFK